MFQGMMGVVGAWDLKTVVLTAASNNTVVYLVLIEGKLSG